MKYIANMKSHNIKAKGFTLVEIMVTLVVTGILVAISVVAYGDYKHKLLVSGLKSDLTTMAGAMENFRTFNNGYSTSSLPTNVSTYQATNGNGSVTLTDGVTIAGGSSDGKTFCIDAVNSSDPSTYYYIDSYTLSQGAQSGSCVDSRPVPQNLLAAMVSNSSIRITWDAADNASSYILEQDTNEAFSSPTEFSQAANTKLSEGLTTNTQYYYRVKAVVAGVAGNWSDVSYANTSLPAPSTPTVAVGLNSTNILATASSAVCSGGGTTQYSFKYRINDSATWSSYSAWDFLATSSITGTQGFKYGYITQARCYVDSNTYSSPVQSSESTYIYHYVAPPSAPTVAYDSPSWSTTNYSWNSTTCPGGASANYQYDFTTSYGYDSGWTSISGTSVGFTTASAGYTYTLQVKTRCYTSYSTSDWSSGGLVSYYRPYTVAALVVGGGGGGGAGDSYGNGGGGGAGGVIYQTDHQIAKQSYAVSVGNGGSGAGSANAGSNGSNSVFSSLTAIGGGGGGGGTYNKSGFSGGSGGGAAASSSGNTYGSSGTSGQGNAGGNSCSSGNRTAGGGGGASGGNYYFNGGCLDGSKSGWGGLGAVYNISGSDVCYAGGGGGGIGSGTEGLGGRSQSTDAGGGSYGLSCGAGRAHQSAAGESAVANTGSGGGGGKGGGGSGGKGIVIVRYPAGAFSTTGGNSVYTVGSDTVVVFTSNGTLTVD